MFFLKVLTNENRGGLNLISFDRSPFKIFSLRFSNKSLQAPSRERPKTLKLLSEPCFYYLQSVVVSQNRHRVSSHCK
jgi:hypothetical protein